MGCLHVVLARIRPVLQIKKLLVLDLLITKNNHNSYARALKTNRIRNKFICAAAVLKRPVALGFRDNRYRRARQASANIPAVSGTN
jgi:hypothetical protein